MSEADLGITADARGRMRRPRIGRFKLDTKGAPGVQLHAKNEIEIRIPAGRRAMMKRFGVRARVPTIGRRDFIKFGAGAGAMMALSTGPAPAQRETSRPVSIDLHTHWAPEPYVKALAELGRPSAITPNP